MTSRDPGLIERLVQFETRDIGPFVTGIGAAPIDDPDFEIDVSPGTILFLMNGSASYRMNSGIAKWAALRVMYCDPNHVTDVVLRIDAEHEVASGESQVVSLEITNLMRLVRQDGNFVWRNAVTNQHLLAFRDVEDTKLIRNFWSLFRGAVLPALYHGSYRFVDRYEDRIRAQANALHHVATIYRELI